MNRAKEIVRIAYQAMDEHKGQEITVLDIHDVSVIADYFIIVSGENDRQVAALQDAVEDALGRAGYEHRSIEGAHTTSWILMDYNDVIIHIFNKEDRLFYDLERIWRDGKRISPENFAND